jgi:hypothetical protein
VINAKNLIAWLEFEIEATKIKEQKLLDIGFKSHSYKHFKLSEQQADFRAALIRVLGKVERMKNVSN